MKKKLFLLLAIVVVLSLMIIVPVNAKKPAPSLSGAMELGFNVGFDRDVVPAYPEEDVVCPEGVTWAGTVTLDGVAYGMVFFPIDGGRFTGKARHFVEVWRVYAEPFDFTPGLPLVCPSSDVVLEGTDKGVWAPNPPKEIDDPPFVAQAKYRMSGSVHYAAPPFSDWDGRRVHMSGYVRFIEIDVPGVGLVQVPAAAPGTFRLN
jgi:hypothetical protein